MSEEDKNNLILQIIDRLKNENSSDDDIKQILQRLTALEIKDNARELKINEITKYTEKKEDKSIELKKFTITKILTIIGLLISIASLVFSIIKLLI